MDRARSFDFTTFLRFSARNATHVRLLQGRKDQRSRSQVMERIPTHPKTLALWDIAFTWAKRSAPVRGNSRSKTERAISWASDEPRSLAGDRDDQEKKGDNGKDGVESQGGREVHATIPGERAAGLPEDVPHRPQMETQLLIPKKKPVRVFEGPSEIFRRGWKLKGFQVAGVVEQRHHESSPGVFPGS